MEGILVDKFKDEHQKEFNLIKEESLSLEDKQKLAQNLIERYLRENGYEGEIPEVLLTDEAHSFTVDSKDKETGAKRREKIYFSINDIADPNLAFSRLFEHEKAHMNTYDEGKYGEETSIHTREKVGSGNKNKVFTEEEMPSFGVSIFTALVPVILMAATAIGKMMNLPKTSTIMVILNFIGDPSVALTISIIIAFYTFGFARGKSMKDIMATSEKAILTVAMILFVVGAGGALKQVLIDSGVGTYIGELVMQVNVSPLVLAWLIAVVIRIAVGSATVAAMTAGGIVAPLIPLTGVSPELMVIAVGAGSVFFSPPNDPGFWLFKEFFGLSVKQTLRSWCMVETVIAVCGLIGVEIINLFL